MSEPVTRTLVTLDADNLRTLIGLVGERRAQVGDTNETTAANLRSLESALSLALYPLDALAAAEPQYPNAERLSARWQEWLQIDGFLDWFDEQGYEICKLDGDEYYPSYESRKSIRDRYLGIDTRAYDNELRAMLDEQRKLNERNDSDAG